MKNTVITTVAAVLAILVAVVCGFLFCTDASFAGVELYALIPIYIILLVLGAFAEGLIHEGAHLLVGVICLMGVKPPKIRIFKSSSVEVFPYGFKCMKARMIATSAAGLFFDFLLIFLGVLSLAVPTVPVFFCIVLPYTLYSFIINAVPFEYKSGKTDGLMVWELITNKPTAQVLLNILKIQGLQHSGKLLRELDEGLFLDVPQLPEDDVNFIILTQLRYEYYLAIGNDSEAYKYFMRYKDIAGYLPAGYDYDDVTDLDVDT